MIASNIQAITEESKEHKVDDFGNPPTETKKSTSFNLTDLGNMERFVRDHRGTIRFNRSNGKWLGYDGKRWNLDIGEDRARCCYMITARNLYDNIQMTTGAENKKELLRFALYSESTKGMHAALSLVKSQPSISTGANEFDTDAFLLNCLNGTINLRSGELRPHNSADLITKLAPVMYDPKATLQLWDDFLETATDGDASLRDFLQIAAGYTATGDTSEERLFFIYGPTASCKSTYLEAMKITLGDYAKTSDFDTFIKRKQVGGVRNDVARLCGSRMVTTSEVDEKQELDENLIKNCSGSDTVTVRFLFKEAFEFKPQFKLWLGANEVPKVRDADDGSMWRRLLRIPFNHTIPKEDRRATVKATLTNPNIAGPAILAWMVEGCLKWQQDGLEVPNIIEQSTDDYRKSQDVLHGFFEDKCDFDNSAYVTVSKMRSAYEQWAKNIGLKYPLGPIAFNKKLRTKGCDDRNKRIPIGDGRLLPPEKCWHGVALKG